MAYLTPGAAFVVAPGVSLADDLLLDVDGRTYRLNRLGFRICQIAQKPITLDSLCRLLAASFDVPSTRIEADARAYLLDLHQRGLVSIHQSFVAECVSSMVVAFGGRRISTAFDVARTRFFRRYPATLGGVVRSVVEAYQTLVWSGLLIAVSAVLVAVVASPGPAVAWLGARALALTVSALVLILVASIVIHELGHLLAARLASSVVYSTYAASGLVGISFFHPVVRRKLAVTAAGPTAGFLFLAGIAALCVWSPASFWAATTFDQFRLSVVVALLTFAGWHLLGFTPLTSDGRALWAMRTRG